MLFLVSISFAYASTLTIRTINDQISPFDFASYNLTIFNDKDKADIYFITTKDIRWSVSSEPLTDYTTGISVPAHAEASTILLIKPTEGVSFGRHDIEIILSSRTTNETLKEIISANVRQDLIRWPTDLSMSVDVPSIMDPRRTSVVKVTLKNNNPLYISNLTIKLKSNIFEKSTQVELLPNQEKVVDFSITFNDSTLEAKDKISVMLFFNNSLIKQQTKDIQIKPISGFKREEKEETKFLKTTKIITYTNDGNVKLSDQIFIETTILKRIFTSTNPKLDLTKKDEKYYFTKQIELDPGQQLKITVTTNYRPLLYIALVIIILFVIYFATRSPIIVRKEAKEIEFVEGGIHKLKVVIKLKNRSRRTIKNLKVVDRIPFISSLVREGAETLKPTKIFPYKDGTAIRYDIGSVEPQEVRIITYVIQTKLGVVGDLRLKPAIVEYEGTKVYSNPLDVYAP